MVTLAVMPGSAVMGGEKTMVRLIGDIFSNLQDIVRAEVSLVKAEATDELSHARSSAAGYGIALLAAVLGACCLTVSAVYALALVMPQWSAALCMALALGVFSCVAFLRARLGMRRHRKLTPQSGTNIREKLAWLKNTSPRSPHAR